jgi:hypothetical protein
MERNAGYDLIIFIFANHPVAQVFLHRCGRSREQGAPPGMFFNQGHDIGDIFGFGGADVHKVCTLVTQELPFLKVGNSLIYSEIA